MSILSANKITDITIEEKPARSIWGEAWLRLRKNKLAMICLAIIALYVTIAILVAAGIVAKDWDKSVGKSYEPPSWKHPLGTDIFGRSVLDKTLYGAKTSLTVAFLASVISVLIGVPLGAIAGYFGKWIDEIIVWLYSTLATVPPILLILAFALVLKNKVLFKGTAYEIPLKGITTVYLAIGLTSWVGLCRLIRGEVIKHKQRDYVIAAKAFGASDIYIIFKHIIPNVFHIVIIYFSLQFVGFIHAEVILSFLGLGAKTQPSWGVMIDNAREVLFWRKIWWEFAAATFAIFFISLALNIFGDALRDALDPKLKNT